MRPDQLQRLGAGCEPRLVLRWQQHHRRPVADGPWLGTHSVAPLLMCATHGAVYQPADGRCAGGRCRGGTLRAHCEDQHLLGSTAPHRRRRARQLRRPARWASTHARAAWRPPSSALIALNEVACPPPSSTCPPPPMAGSRAGSAARRLPPACRPAASCRASRTRPAACSHPPSSPARLRTHA